MPFPPDEFQSFLLRWFDQNRRNLPWRRNRTPYRVWISEIMLQQTRVDTVIPYFERWMHAFPDIASVATAELQTVLTQWEGLGYYSRARSIHKAAQSFCAVYGCIIPNNPVELKKIPGIGPYSSASIASIAFGYPIAAVDGNIRRIITRLFDIAESVKERSVQKEIHAKASALLSSDRPGDFNEALMDLGSAICVPNKPNCTVCPLQEFCVAYKNGTVAERPILPKAESVPHYTVSAAVIHNRGCILLAQRPEKGLLGGLWEFPGGKIEAGESAQQALIREIQEELACDIVIEEAIGIYKHAYTHFKITLHAFSCTLSGIKEPTAIEAQRLSWVTTDELKNYPMGKVDRLIAEELKKREWQN